MTEGVPVSQARRSALVVAVCFGLLSAWQIYRAHTMLAWIFGVSAVALLVCRMIPVAAVAFHRGWMALAEALGYVNSRILLSLIYYLIIAPTALVLRLIGRDPLDRRGARRSSYWVARPRVEPSRERFERAY